MIDLSYKIEDGVYGLYDGEELIHKAGEEVAISYVYWEDPDGSVRGFINKHGSKENVKLYHDNAVEKYRALSEEGLLFKDTALEMLNQIYFISGKFELEELNKCLAISDYIARWHKNNIL